MIRKSHNQMLARCVALLLLLFCLPAHAYSSDFGVTQGYQDVLMIGEIVQRTEEGAVTVQVAHFFAESSQQHQVPKEIQIQPFSYAIYGAQYTEKANPDGSIHVTLAEGKEAQVPAVGDCAFLSLKARDDGSYSIENTALKVDQSDPQTLRFYAWSEHNGAELALFTYFVRNGGQPLEHYGQGDHTYIYTKPHQPQPNDPLISPEDERYAALLFPQAARNRHLPEGTLATTAAIQKAQAAPLPASSTPYALEQSQTAPPSDTIQSPAGAPHTGWFAIARWGLLFLIIVTGIILRRRRR